MRRLPFYVALATIFTATSLLGSAFAASLNLRDQPSDTAKVTGSVDLSAGIIPIYTPPDSQWVKIADPRNGNTGWVKSSELVDSKGNKITFSQKVSDDGKSQSVQITSGNAKPMTQEQIAAQQKEAQESLMKLQQNATQMLQDVKKIYDQQAELLQKAGYPIMMPPMPTVPVPNAAAAVQKNK